MGSELTFPCLFSLYCSLFTAVYRSIFHRIYFALSSVCIKTWMFYSILFYSILFLLYSFLFNSILLYCTAHQFSPLRRKFMEFYIINPVLSLLMKHLVTGQRQKAPNFSAFHWSLHGSLVSICQHFVTTRVVHLPKTIETSLITESDQSGPNHRIGPGCAGRA